MATVRTVHATGRKGAQQRGDPEGQWRRQMQSMLPGAWVVGEHAGASRPPHDAGLEMVLGCDGACG